VWPLVRVALGVCDLLQCFCLEIKVYNKFLVQLFILGVYDHCTSLPLAIGIEGFLMFYYTSRMF